MMLALALAAALQAPPPPAAGGDGDILVLGERMPDRLRERARVVARHVDAILPPTTVDQPYARYGTALCPGLIGLDRATAQAIVDRIGVIADELGLRVGAPGCAANLLVIVTDDSAATVRWLTARRAGNFASQTLADIRRLHAERGGARGWTETEVRNREGQRPWVVGPSDTSGLPPGTMRLDVPTVGRVELGFRRDIVSSVILIDADAARRRDPMQIADYAAMRGLAGVRPDRLRVADSILNAFTPDGDATAPKGLTDTDRGILRALYEGPGNRPSGIKRGAMVRRVLAIEDTERDRQENEQE